MRSGMLYLTTVSEEKPSKSVWADCAGDDTVKAGNCTAWEYPSQKRGGHLSPPRKGNSRGARSLRLGTCAGLLRGNPGAVALNCDSFFKSKCCG